MKRHLTVFVSLCIAGCAGHQPPVTPAQAQALALRYATQAEHVMRDIGTAATGVRDLARIALANDPTRRASFEADFTKLQGYADSTIDFIHAGVTGGNPDLAAIHARLQGVSDLLMPLLGFAQSFVPATTDLGKGLNLAITSAKGFMAVALQLTAPAGPDPAVETVALVLEAA